MNNMNKKMRVVTIAFLVVLVGLLCLFFYKKNMMKETNSGKSEKIHSQLYPYANSTDIYSVNGRYALDGTKRKEIHFLHNEGYDVNIVYVNDKWLYYSDYYDGENGMLRRIPLHKGKDNRDIVDEKKAECVRDVYNENGFTVNGDYYAGISYGTVAMLWNLETKQKVRQKIPEEIAYSHSEETEDKYWYVLEQNDDWILWEGEHGTMLQMIPSGQVYAIEKKPVEMVIQGNNCIFYTTNSKCCYKYDFIKKEKTLWLKEAQIKNIVCDKLKLSKEVAFSCIIDRVMSDEKKIYWQIRVRTSKQKSSGTRYIVLTQSRDSDELPSYDENLTDILQKYGSGKSKFLVHIGEYWYLQNNGYFCYSARTNEVKKLEANDPEWNILYAVLPEGIYSETLSYR